MKWLGRTIYNSGFNGAACHYSDRTGLFVYIVSTGGYSYSIYKVSPPFFSPDAVPVKLCDIVDMYFTNYSPVLLETGVGEYIAFSTGSSRPGTAFGPLYQGVTFNTSGDYVRLDSTIMSWAGGASPIVGMVLDKPYWDGALSGGSSDAISYGSFAVKRMVGNFIGGDRYISTLNRGYIVTPYYPVGSYSDEPGHVGKQYSLDGTSYLLSQLPGAYTDPFPTGTYTPTVGLRANNTNIGHFYRNSNNGGYGQAWGSPLSGALWYFPSFGNASDGHQVSTITGATFLDSLTGMDQKSLGVRPDEKLWIFSNSTNHKYSSAVSRFSSGTAGGVAPDASLNTGIGFVNRYTIGRSGQSLLVGGINVSGGGVFFGEVFDGTIPVPVSTTRRGRRSGGALPFFPAEISEYL